MSSQRTDSPYQPFTGVEANISDNQIGSPEHIIRNYLLHAYEDGYHYGAKQPKPFVELFSGAALTCGCSGFVTLCIEQYVEATVWFSIAVALAVLTLLVYIFYSYKKKPSHEDVCKKRDEAVNDYINQFYSGAATNQSTDAYSQTAEHNGTAQ